MHYLYCVDFNGNEKRITVQDVCFATLWRKHPLSTNTKICFHTRDGQYLYRLNGSLEAVVAQFEQYGFYPLDATNVVNLNNIVCVDFERKMAYFDNNLHTSIADGKMPIVRHLPPKS